MVWAFGLRCLLAAASTGGSAVGVLAQAPGGHAEHHPGATSDAAGMSPPASPTTSPVNPPAGVSSTQQTMPGMGSGSAVGGGEMGGMMGGMGEMMGRPRKEFYPSLMDLPTLSPEQRQVIEAQARARVSTGLDEVASAQMALRHANAAGDAAGAEQAASRLRDGLNLVSSGTAALRSLAEGKTPQQVAQDWFKGQLNLTAPEPRHTGAGPFGLSWFHLITMSVVAAFAAAMLALYLVRMRRANALVSRLTSTPVIPVPPAPPAAPAAATPPSSLSPRAAPAPATVTPASAPSAAPEPAPPFPATAPAPAGARPRTGLWKGQLRVAAIFRETPLVKTFRLRDPDGGPIPFTFLPGQFLTYSAEIDGKLVRRSYTIASSAAQTAYVETTIKREEPGVFSDYMHDEIVEGDLINVMAPSGVFTFTGKEADSVVLVGGGVGITPLMAAVRYLFDMAWPGEIFLIYGARSTEEFIFRDEIEYLQRRMRNFHVHAAMARAPGTAWMGHEGPLTKGCLTQTVPDIATRRIHLCGPPGMMEAVRTFLSELGVPPEQVKTEAFGPALGAVPPPGVTQVKPVQPAAVAPIGAPAPPATTTPVIGPATATVRFAKSNVTAPLPPDRSVLEVSEDVGVNIDYSCRVGICGVCKTQLLEGKVTMEVQEALTPEDKARNIILACQAKSIGNLVVEA